MHSHKTLRLDLRSSNVRDYRILPKYFRFFNLPKWPRFQSFLNFQGSDSDRKRNLSYFLRIWTWILYFSDFPRYFFLLYSQKSRQYTSLHGGGLDQRRSFHSPRTVSIDHGDCDPSGRIGRVCLCEARGETVGIWGGGWTRRPACAYLNFTLLVPTNTGAAWLWNVTILEWQVSTHIRFYCYIQVLIR